jgi:hypothetical protein
MEPPEISKRTTAPASLAQSLAAQGSHCPIPFTHDRLHEIHHWWHQMARNYHEPEPFRYSLGAFIQAARGVTFMLQKEKAAFKDFSWYDKWVEEAKDNPLLRWLNDARINVVHRQSLEPNSWIEVDCIDNPRSRLHTEDDEDDDVNDGPLVGKVNPFMCTHEFIAKGPSTDHCHKFTRQWGIEGLPGKELLEVCAEVYDRLDEVVEEAHKQAGGKMVSHKKVDSVRALPCMEHVEKHRLVRTVLRDGHEVWEDEPPGLHSH